MILAERAARMEAEAERSSNAALIAHLKLEIEKLGRTLYGSSSERKTRLLDQMELQLEELEAAATEDELAAHEVAAKAETVRSFQRKRPVRKPFPNDIERERVSSRRRRVVHAVAVAGCRSWVRTSPRRWR